MIKDMQKAFKKILDSNSIVLVTHINPDGDTIGSALALYPLLNRMGKKVYLFNKSKELPKQYDFLPNFSKFRDKLPSKYDLMIVLDAGDIKRTGINEEIKVPIINIDHHKSTTNFGDFNIVLNSPSTTLVVYEFLIANKIKISRDIAQAIYTGLVSDTEFFLYRGVDERTFEIASKLVKAGANPAVVGENIKGRDSLAKLRLTELFLKSIELKKDARVAVGVLTQKDFLKSGATISDSEHLVNIIISLATVKLAIFMRELDKNIYKFSLRSKGNLDVSKIAINFGGGGHLNAAGFIGEKNLLEKILEGIEVEDV